MNSMLYQYKETLKDSGLDDNKIEEIFKEDNHKHDTEVNKIVGQLPMG